MELLTASKRRERENKRSAHSPFGVGDRDPYSVPLSTSKSAVLSKISWALGDETVSNPIIEDADVVEEIWMRPELAL